MFGLLFISWILWIYLWSNLSSSFLVVGDQKAYN
jgi:hypothetical protein